jgi:hypothetical protein
VGRQFRSHPRLGLDRRDQDRALRRHAPGQNDGCEQQTAATGNERHNQHFLPGGRAPDLLLDKGRMRARAGDSRKVACDAIRKTLRVAEIAAIGRRISL